MTNEAGIFKQAKGDYPTRRANLVIASSFDIRDSGLKLPDALALEANPVSAGMGGARCCHEADTLVFAEGVLLHRPGSRSAPELCRSRSIPDRTE